MNDAGDYSAAYCILKTDGPLEGHGMVSENWFIFYFAPTIIISESSQADWVNHRHSLSVAETTSSAKQLRMSLPALSAGPSKSSPRTWARPGGISLPIPSCVGLVLRYLFFLSMHSGMRVVGVVHRGSHTISTTLC